MQPNTSYDESLVLYHLSSESTYYTIFRNSVVTGAQEKSVGSGGRVGTRVPTSLVRVGRVAGFLLPQVGEEVHFQRICQFCRGFEREVDVAGEDLGYVRPRDIHPPCELGLGDAELLHATEDPTKEG